jgi:ribosomal-protein-alanine N-acetyltransferase
MAYIFRPLEQTDAAAIAAWRYDDPYSFYNLDQDPEDLAEFMDPANWPERYFAVCDEANGLVGFFGFERENSGWVTIGLGMRPDLTGRGLGKAFLEAGLAFARERWQPEVFALGVAAFNERAIRLYERVGFVRVHQYMQATNGGHYPFVSMVRGG